MASLPGVEYKKTGSNPSLESDNTIYILEFSKDVDYMCLTDNFVNFVKQTEKLIRTSSDYRKYISYIKGEVGLTFCQVLSNVEESEKVEIEMHHGPILTLFDIVSIVTDYLLSLKGKTNTFEVADIVLDEHYNNNIQVVMLSKTVHQEVHDFNIFINTKQAFGDINKFLDKYYRGLNDDLIAKINKYIDNCEKYDSFDKDVLTLQDKVLSWSRY